MTNQNSKTGFSAITDHSALAADRTSGYQELLFLIFML